jgi:hypothetical protein
MFASTIVGKKSRDQRMREVWERRRRRRHERCGKGEKKNPEKTCGGGGVCGERKK